MNTQIHSQQTNIHNKTKLINTQQQQKLKKPNNTLFIKSNIQPKQQNSISTQTNPQTKQP